MNNQFKIEDVLEMDYEMDSFGIAGIANELSELQGAFFDKAFQLENDAFIIRFNLRKDKMTAGLKQLLSLDLEYAEGRDFSELEEIDPHETVTGEEKVPLEHEDLQETQRDIDLGIGSGGRYVKVSLCILPGSLMFLTTKRFQHPRLPPSFAMLLRKYLGNKRLYRVEQHKFDRVLKLYFGSEENMVVMVLEMFGKGNVLLVKDSTIIQPLYSRSYSSRELRARREYVPPPDRFDPIHAGYPDLLATISKSKVDLIRCLTVDLNLGPIVSNEIVMKLELDKNLKISEMDSEEKNDLARYVENFLSDMFESERFIMYLRKEKIQTVSLIPLCKYNDEPGIEETSFQTLNSAMETIGLKMITDSGRQDLILDDDDEVGSRKKAGSSLVDKIERRIFQQEKAIGSFKDTMDKNRELADIFYQNYKRLSAILTALNDAKENLGWDELEKRIADIPDIEAVAPSTSIARIGMMDKDGTKIFADLDIRLDVNENASLYYSKSKKAKLKIKGAEKALEKSHRDLKRAKRKADEAIKQESELQSGDDMIHSSPSKRFWFENFRWFVTSHGNIAVGGKDATSNEKVVKKYLDAGCRFIHTDDRGSPCVVVLPGNDEKPITDNSLLECGVFAVSHSKAWKNSLASATAYWVKPEQVSKTPQSGEYLPKGSFMIRGKRNWMPKLEMRLAIGEVVIESLRKIMCGPESSLSKHSDRFVLIAPGEIGKNEMAKKLSRIFRFSNSEILSLLPTGGMRITGSKGIKEDKL